MGGAVAGRARSAVVKPRFRQGVQGVVSRIVAPEKPGGWGSTGPRFSGAISGEIVAREGGPAKRFFCGDRLQVIDF